MSRKPMDSAISKVAVLGSIVAGVGLFIVMLFATDKLFTSYPYAVLVILLAISVFLVSQTVSLLYDFYDAPKPIGRFVPIFGELYLLDTTYRSVVLGMYIGVVAFVILGAMPYNIKSVLGEWFALHSSFYMFLIAFAIIVISQIVYGIGLINTMNDISKDWARLVKTDLGSLRHFKLLGFIPVIRLLTFYAVNKPLSTMVSYYGMTNDNDEEFTEEYEEEDYEEEDDDD